MEKIKELEDSGYFYKYYNEPELDLKQFYQNLRDSEMKIRKVSLDEDVDPEMMNTTGSCGIDFLIDNLDTIISNSSDLGRFSITVHGKFNDADVNIYTYPKESTTIGIQSIESSLELPEIMVKKSDDLGGPTL